MRPGCVPWNHQKEIRKKGRKKGMERKKDGGEGRESRSIRGKRKEEGRVNRKEEN